MDRFVWWCRRALVWAAVLGLLAALGACTSSSPRSLPDHAPARTEALPDDRIRVWPRSAPIEVGVVYRMRPVTHCGLDHLFDLDGSFWEVVARPDPAGDHLGDPYDDGTVSLVDEDTAVYESSTGAEYRLTRLEGPREVWPCE